MRHRMQEHKYALTSGNADRSAVAEHAVATGHAIEWEEEKVIDTQSEFHQ